MSTAQQNGPQALTNEEASDVCGRQMDGLVLPLDKRASRRVAQGYPWVFASDVLKGGRPKGLSPGAAVRFADQDGRLLASGYANPHSTLLGRVLSTSPDVVDFDRAFFEKRLSLALELREQFFDTPFYRLVHAESDGLPGLIVDRFGEILSCQFNTAGIEMRRDDVIAALEAVTGAKTIVLRNDGPVREQEGLDRNIEYVGDKLPQDGLVELMENGVRFQADLAGGQKTGWFYDQRQNRDFVASLAQGKTMLDIFCYSGGFGVTAAVRGAEHVVFVDRSAEALELARKNARLNNVLDRCEFFRDKAYRWLDQMVADGKQYDVVCVDPPAFIKSRRDIKSGLRGYGKLARQAAMLVRPGGWLFMASCSHHAAATDLQEVIANGIARAGRAAQLVRTGATAPDHPVHPLLPETGYLKSFAYRFPFHPVLQ